MGQLPALSLTTCPACSAPAEISDRFALESSDGPIEHVRVRCVRRHWFAAPSALLEARSTLEREAGRVRTVSPRR